MFQIVLFNRTELQTLSVHEGLWSTTRQHVDSVEGNDWFCFLNVGGKAFGVGALEDEDEEVYHRDAMSNYDMVLGGEEPGDGLYGWTAPQQYKKKKGTSGLHVIHFRFACGPLPVVLLSLLYL